MKPNTLMDVTELAWDDIRTHGEGTEFGVVVIVLHNTGTEMQTQVGANVEPAIVKLAVAELARDWDRTGGDFHVFPPKKLRKAV
jgi:hypothetical protein